MYEKDYPHDVDCLIEKNVKVVEMMLVWSIGKNNYEIQEIVQSKTSEIILKSIWKIQENEVDKNVYDINRDVSTLNIVKVRLYGFFDVAEDLSKHGRRCDKDEDDDEKWVGEELLFSADFIFAVRMGLGCEEALETVPHNQWKESYWIHILYSFLKLTLQLCLPISSIVYLQHFVLNRKYFGHVNYNHSKDNQTFSCTDDIVIANESEGKHQALEDISFIDVGHLVVERVRIIAGKS